MGDIEGVRNHSEGASSCQWKGIIPALAGLATVAKAIGDPLRFPSIPFTALGAHFYASMCITSDHLKPLLADPEYCLRLHYFADAESQSTWETACPSPLLLLAEADWAESMKALPPDLRCCFHSRLRQGMAFA